MADFKNCVNEITGCCSPCKGQAPMKDNCKCEGCNPVTVTCSSIDNAICVPALTQQIYDCICIEKEESLYNENLSFKLTNENPESYNDGDPVCIQKIGISYDYIGLATSASNATVVIDGTDYILNPTSQLNCGTMNLFNELNGTISLEPCCCDSSTQIGAKIKIIEKNREFYACNLKVCVSGIIGCKPFTGEAFIFIGENPFPLRRINFRPMTFAGRLCWPKGINRLTINEILDICLSVDCIIPETNYRKTGIPVSGTFRANVDFSLKINKKIYASNTEALAVLTTPNASICKNGEIVGGCPSNCL